MGRLCGEGEGIGNPTLVWAATGVGNYTGSGATKGQRGVFELGLAGSLVDPGCQAANLEQVGGLSSPQRLDRYLTYHGT